MTKQEKCPIYLEHRDLQIDLLRVMYVQKIKQAKPNRKGVIVRKAGNNSVLGGQSVISHKHFKYGHF